MRLTVKNNNPLEKAVGITLRTFSSERNRSLNNDFDSIKLRKNFVQVDKSMATVLRSVPKSKSTLTIKLRTKSSKHKPILRRYDTGKRRPFLRYGPDGNKPMKNFYLNDESRTVLFSEDLFGGSPYFDTGDFGD